jgi:hypothetical protein
MGLVLVSVHEMFYPLFGARAGRAAVAQVEHEARIMGGKPAEPGRRHSRPAQEGLYLADEHGDSFFALPRFALLERASPDAARGTRRLDD